MQEIVDANPSLRRKVYTAYALIGFVLGAIQVGVAAAETGQPVWLTVAFAVFGFAGTAFGFGARSKVDATPITAPVVIEQGTGRHRAEAGA